MSTDRLIRLVTGPQERATSPVSLIWLGLSLAFSLYCASMWVERASRQQYVIQSDARQVTTWYLRYVDPELFKNDLIADYYLSANTPGFAAVYRAGAALGVDPIKLSKFLPLIIGLAATAFCFALFMELLPVPAGAFIACLLLNQYVWTDDSICSATPRSFLYPLFLAFLLYLSKKSLVPTLLTVALQGLIYPPVMLVSAIVLVLSPIGWKGGRLAFSKDRKEYVLVAAGLAVAALAILFYALESSEFGHTVTASEAKALPIGLAGKRLSFLNQDALTYWITDSQSGLYWRRTIPPFGIFAALILPALLVMRSRFPLVSRVKPGIKLLPRTLIASIFMFFVAHLLLFKLYLPNRYTIHTFPIVLSLAAGVAFTLVLDAALRPQGEGRKLLAYATVTVVAAVLFSYPFTQNRFPKMSIAIGRQKDLYRFLQEQPKDSLIATLSAEADNLPSFARRSVLAAPHFANPYQPQYYLELNRRYSDLIEAVYSPDQGQICSFINKYGVDYLLVESGTFSQEYVTNHPVMMRFQAEADAILERFDSGITPALPGLMKDCAAFESKQFTLVRGDCVCNKSHE